MSILKRILSICLVMSMLISLLACGEYNQGYDGEHQNKPGGGTEDATDDTPELDDDPTNDFSVQLSFDGQPFIPSVKIYVYWNDGYNVHSAPVDKTGRAVIDGLDGDYRVTLSTVPSGYAYDPNSYLATNNHKNLVIELLDLNVLRGSGTGLYECYNINETGVYTVTIEKPEDLVYIEFSPRTNGVYTVESWANVVDNDINPI